MLTCSCSPYTNGSVTSLSDSPCWIYGSFFKGHSSVMAACCANWVRMITRSSPSVHRKHKLLLSHQHAALLLCWERKTQHRTLCFFLFTSGHSSFRHYLQAIKIISAPITFFSISPQATHQDVWLGGSGPLNMNHYANKKSAAESMLDVALLMANASQLKAVMEQGPNFSLYTPTITLISISLCLQVTVGVLLIFIG